MVGTSRLYYILWKIELRRKIFNYTLELERKNLEFYYCCQYFSLVQIAMSLAKNGKKITTVHYFFNTTLHDRWDLRVAR